MSFAFKWIRIAVTFIFATYFVNNFRISRFKIVHAMILSLTTRLVVMHLLINDAWWPMAMDYECMNVDLARDSMCTHLVSESNLDSF